MWEKFVKEVSPVVFSVLKKTLITAGHAPDEAYDLLQDLFVKLCSDNFRVLKKYDPERSRLTTWLALIARHMAIDHLRRCKKMKVSVDTIPEPVAQEKKSEMNGFTLSLNQLPPRQRLIMKLLYEQDMEVREVASLLEITEQTVRSMRHKAVKKLRTIWKKS